MTPPRVIVTHTGAPSPGAIWRGAHSGLFTAHAVLYAFPLATRRPRPPAVAFR
jgi:hypothetical protein